MADLNWKTGFEIELLAPRGKSRFDLATAIAENHGGTVRRCFYPQSEPSLVPGTKVFENLTLGFDCRDGQGNLLAKCVDDLTIRADLDRHAAPVPGWYRIVSDDARLLRLVMAQCDAEAAAGDVLRPVARLFKTEPIQERDGIVRLVDGMRAPLALLSGLPGERHRPCELITPPLETGHLAYLEGVLAIARDLGFTLPLEAATHVHFDATRLRSASVFATLVRIVSDFGAQFRSLMAANRNCTRLGPVPQELVNLVSEPGFVNSSWEKALGRLRAIELSKYCDFNFLNIVHDTPGKSTFEVRILPGMMEAREIVECAAFFEAILNWCVERRPAQPLPGDMPGLIEVLSMDEDLCARLLRRAQAPARSLLRRALRI